MQSFAGFEDIADMSSGLPADQQLTKPSLTYCRTALSTPVTGRIQALRGSLVSGTAFRRPAPAAQRAGGIRNPVVDELMALVRRRWFYEESGLCVFMADLQAPLPPG